MRRVSPPEPGDTGQSDPNNDESLPVTQAAKFLALSASHLNRLRVEGGGPEYFRTPGGHRVFYTRPDLRAWRERLRISTAARMESAGAK
jgi:hypothetical protein